MVVALGNNHHSCLHLLFDTLRTCVLKAAHILLDSCWMPPFHKFLMRAPTNVPETIRVLKVGAHSLCATSLFDVHSEFRRLKKRNDVRI